MASSHSPTRLISTGFSLFFQTTELCKISVWFLCGAVAFSLLLAMPVAAKVGVSLIGIVSDSTGLPIPGATIIVDPGETSTSTNWAGSFELNGLIDGRYHLSISRLGYAPLSYGPVRIRKGEVSRIRIELTQSPITLPENEVIISGRNSLSISRSNIVLTRKDWQILGARNLADALRQAPGITILEGGRITRITIRGSPSRAVEIDRDGVPMHNIASGETDLSSIQLDDLEAIGIETGGAGGKVHLVSKDFLSTSSINQKVFDGSIEAFSTAGAKADASVGLNLEQTGIEGGFGGAHDRGIYHYKLDDGSIHERINNKSSSLSGYSRVSLKFRSMKISAAIYSDNLDRGVPHLIYDVPTPDASLKNQRFTARLGAEIPVNENRLEAFVYTQQYTGEFINPEFQIHPESRQLLHFNPEHSTQNGSRTGASLHYQLILWHVEPRIALRASLDKFIGRDEINNRVNVGVGFGSAKRRTYEAEIGLKKQKSWHDWKLILSPVVIGIYVRDMGGRSYRNILPTMVGSLEHPFNWGSAGITYKRGRSIVVPSFDALLTSENLYAVGNRNLRPERGEAEELNFDLKGNFGIGLSKLSVTSFHRNIDDLIVWQRNAFSKYYPNNLAKSFARGVETTLSISFANDKINLFGSYIYNRSTNETPGDINRGNITPLSPINSGSASMNFRSSQWGVNLSGRWVGLRYSTMANYDPISTAGMGLPYYALYDIALDYKPFYRSGKMTFTVGLDNILDTEYRIIERSPMPGRTYFFRASAEIN